LEKKHIWGRNEYSFLRNEWVKKGVESGEQRVGDEGEGRMMRNWGFRIADC
jgi:hypothetical protein